MLNNNPANDGDYLLFGNGSWEMESFAIALTNTQNAKWIGASQQNNKYGWIAQWKPCKK